MWWFGAALHVLCQCSAQICGELLDINNVTAGQTYFWANEADLMETAGHGLGNIEKWEAKGFTAFCVYL